MNRDFYEKLGSLILENKQAWVITIIQNTGSIPGKIGMKMAINNNMQIYGTIGGGLLEHWVIKRVSEDLPTETEVWSYDLNEDFEKQVGMICGGELSVLVEPLIAGEKLIIFGGGHCAMAMSKLASECGFLVYVLDDRIEWASKEKHPYAYETIVCVYSQIEAYINLDKDNYYLIMTHGHKHDELILQQLIEKDLRYLGMMGSKQKIEISFSKLRKQGIPEEFLEKVYAPVGLPIGSHEPMEIAVSIMAQILKIKNKK